MESVMKKMIFGLGALFCGMSTSVNAEVKVHYAIDGYSPAVCSVINDDDVDALVEEVKADEYYQDHRFEEGEENTPSVLTINFSVRAQGDFDDVNYRDISLRLAAIIAEYGEEDEHHEE